MKISEQPQNIGPTLKIFLSMYVSVHCTGLKSHLLPIVSRCLMCLFKSRFGICTYATIPEATTPPLVSNLEGSDCQEDDVIEVTIHHIRKETTFLDLVRGLV